jgi:hypothetical protein
VGNQIMVKAQLMGLTANSQVWVNCVNVSDVSEVCLLVLKSYNTMKKKRNIDLFNLQFSQLIV